METVVVDDGATIAWTRTGTLRGPTLLLSNSIGTNLSMWDPQMAVLGERFCVLRYDTRGHGCSEAPAGPYTLERLARDAAAVLDAADAARAHVCGLSLGGVIAQRLAVDRPERIDRLVLANTAARIGTREGWQARIDTIAAGGLEAISEMAMQRFFGEAFRSRNPEIVDRFRTMLVANSPIGYAGCCHALRDADLTSALSRITASALVIGGTDDVSTPAAQAEALSVAIPGARVVLLNAAHMSSVERPDDFNRALLDFLQ
ncbi:3-oxoadipate enol-lactonase [uncultured Methylobacterium sp.]|jgi:3-oxoadipate enol-lactonase|uniref:3-oxoadipate enol-lactonase n=1 Tax=uncultured Methylobacterium sp. TaxID=157278 RepID=UPI00261C558B|nr:3-oxoadipate enol-lactonase [uncultured Methylobacterium sp.]